MGRFGNLFDLGKKKTKTKDGVEAVPPSNSSPGQTVTTTEPGAPPNDSFSRIADNYTSLEQVQQRLRETGLESSSLIVSVDFTASNEWNGKKTFGGRSLHHLSPDQPNPYQQAISLIARTLRGFDDDELYPAYGFGDASTKDKNVFSFWPEDRPCNGLDEVLSRYKQLAEDVRLSGPTSFAPAIYQAMHIVKESGFQYHILLIIADGQVTQEQVNMKAIEDASRLPLSIIAIGVGDGEVGDGAAPWAAMHKFDDELPKRQFDNFQFVNFTEVEAATRGMDEGRREALFALKALMEVPEQYQAIRRLNLLGTTQNVHLPNYKPPLPPPPKVLEADARRAGVAERLEQLHLNGGVVPGAPYRATTTMMAAGASLAGPPTHPQHHQQYASQPYPPAQYPSTHPSTQISGVPSEAFQHQHSSAREQHAVPQVPGRLESQASLPSPFDMPEAGPGIARGPSTAPQRQPTNMSVAGGPGPARGPSFDEGAGAGCTIHNMMVCPLTLDLMEDPVLAEDGHTYERAAIEAWFERGNTTSPLTREELPGRTLLPQRALRAAIQETKDQREAQSAAARGGAGAAPAPSAAAGTCQQPHRGPAASEAARSGDQGAPIDWYPPQVSDDPLHVPFI